MKERKIQFDCFWDWNHWHLFPAISLDNYENQFDIHFQFMGFWSEIAFMKKKPLTDDMNEHVERITRCDCCSSLEQCIKDKIVVDCTTLKDWKKHYYTGLGCHCPAQDDLKEIFGK